MNVLPPKMQDASSLLQHTCRLSFTTETDQCRMTGIVCTIGPSCRNVEAIYQLIKAGMTVARMNFSHEAHEQHRLTVECVQQAVRKFSMEQDRNVHIAIAGDLKGREIRTGKLQSGPRTSTELRSGEYVRLSLNPDLYNRCSAEVLYIDYPALMKDVNVGQRIAIDDGAIIVEVREIGVDSLLSYVLIGGQLGDNLNVTVPGVTLGLPVVSQKDENDIKFCIENNVDFMFVPKVRLSSDIQEVRRWLGLRGKHMKVFAKLENAEALENLEGILTIADGIVFARADLSTEMSVGKVFLAQKAVTAMCNQRGKPIICATQVLASMCNSPVPLRNEVSDIGNALLDGADCLMLSSETATGQYPLEAVATLADALREAESAVWHRKLFEDLINNNPAAMDGMHAVAISAITASINSMAKAIVVLTVSGKSAQMISMYRPRCPIFAVTRCNRVARQMTISRGIIPILAEGRKDENYIYDIDERVNEALTLAYRMGVVRTGDAIVVLSPWKHNSGFTNNIHVVYAFFEKDPVECMIEKEIHLIEKAPMGKFPYLE